MKMNKKTFFRFSSEIAYEARILHPRLFLARTLLAPLPPFFGNGVRSRVLRMCGFHIGPRTHMFDVPRIVGFDDIYSKLWIGSDCLLSVQIYIDLADSITIGNRTAIGQQAMLITGNHATGYPEQRLGRLVPMPIQIGNGVWLGARCTILPGVTIGDGAVVGAGSVVTGDLPPHTYAAGFPAVPKKKLPNVTR